MTLDASQNLRICAGPPSGAAPQCAAQAGDAAEAALQGKPLEVGLDGAHRAPRRSGAATQNSRVGSQRVICGM